MKQVKCTCECLEKLIELGKVTYYCPPYNVLADNVEAEEGQLCLVTQVAEDNGCYDDYNWISNLHIYNELYPIEYCPICGKEIEYIKFNQLTKIY